MSRELIEEGRYDAVAIPGEDGSYVQFGETSNGNDQVAVAFKIVEGDHAGRVLTWFGYFTEKTHEITIKALRVCGFKGDDLMQLASQTIDQKVSLVIAHETNNEGVTYARIQWVNAPGGGGFQLKNKMAPDKLRMFAAKFKNAVKKVPEVSAPQSDDIPF